MAVAENAFMLVLALLKRLPEAAAIPQEAGEWGPVRRTDENTFAFNWSHRDSIRCLVGRQVGILGFGEIGMELARRLRGFAPGSIRYHKRTRLPAEAEAELGVAYADPETILKASEILIVLLPYSPASDRLLNRDAFAAMPRGSFLVHCGSGRVIDERALARAVESGHLGGAALDAFEWEPLRPDNPLLALSRDPAKNVILTPHTAAGTRELAKRERLENWENVRRLVAREPLLYQIR